MIHTFLRRAIKNKNITLLNTNLIILFRAYAIVNVLTIKLHFILMTFNTIQYIPKVLNRSN